MNCLRKQRTNTAGLAFGVVVLAAGMTLVSQCGPAHAATDTCGVVVGDYKGTFTGSADVGNGPQKVTYTVNFPSAGWYTAELAVSDSNNDYVANGTVAVQSSAGVGAVELTMPVLTSDGSVEYDPVIAVRTACSASATVNSFVVSPDGSTDITLAVAPAAG